MGYFSFLRDINFLNFTVEWCTVIDANLTFEIKSKCKSSGGYIPNYRDVVRPRINGTLFDQSITFQDDEKAEHFGISRQIISTADLNWINKLWKPKWFGNRFGLCEFNGQSSPLLNEFERRQVINFLQNRTQFTFPLHHFNVVLNSSLSRQNPDHGTIIAIAECLRPNPMYAKIMNYFKEENGNQTLYPEYIEGSYKMGLIWCNNQIKSSISNVTRSSYFHTGTKFYDSKRLIDENGDLAEYNDTLYIFEVCQNDFYWMTDFQATQFRYPCCINHNLQLGLFIAIIGTIFENIFLTIFIAFSLFFVISFPALIGWIQGAHKRYKGRTTETEN